jgi:hypothetical protein
LMTASLNDPLETGSDLQSTSLQSFAPQTIPGRKPVPLLSNCVATLNRFVKDTDDPWYPPTIAPSASENKELYYDEPNIDYFPYCPPPSSEREGTAYYLSDSGYHTAPPAPSINSGSYPDLSPENQHLDVPLSDFDMSPMLESQPGNGPNEAQDASEPVLTTTKSKPARGGKRVCEKCQKVLKCPSDYKYVVSRPNS